jgi:poly-gamma-glutamate synthesis protein (capsule biosynthesis protein)
LWLALATAACRAPPNTVAAGGDLQLGANATTAQVENLGELLVGDVRFVNLEGPLAGGDESLTGRLRFAGPPHAARWLDGQVDVVSLANNHALDQGVAGRVATWRTLANAGIAGAYPGRDAALERRGRKIVLLARDLSRGWTAADERELAASVRDASQDGTVVLVSLHWGREGSLLPSSAQRRLAAKLARAGTSAVLGHGPHTVQGLETIDGAIVAYSLGNLAYTCRCTNETDAMVLRFAVDQQDRAVAVTAVPVEAGLGGAPPRRSSDPELAELIAALSRDLGSDARVTEGVVHLSP